MRQILHIFIRFHHMSSKKKKTQIEKHILDFQISLEIVASITKQKTKPAKTNLPHPSLQNSTLGGGRERGGG